MFLKKILIVFFFLLHFLGEAGAQCPSYSISTTKNDITSCWSDKGSISISIPTATGITGPFHYLLDGGYYSEDISVSRWWDHTTRTFTHLDAKKYTVSTVDVNGCQSNTVEIDILNTAPNLDFNIRATNPSCTGTPTTGEVVLSIGGLSYANHEYHVRDNNSGALRTSADTAFSGLSTGNYSAYISQNSDGCLSKTKEFNISHDIQFITEIRNRGFCESSTSGEIHIRQPSNLSDPSSTDFEYSFDNGVTYGATSVKTGLDTGNYYISVRDASCASSPERIRLRISDSIQYTLSSTDPICFGDAGQIEFSGVVGGRGAYTYLIDGSAVAPSSYAKSGTYSTYITDESGCESKRQNITISDPTKVSYTVLRLNPPSCPLGSGSVVFEGSVGEPGRLLTWHVEGFAASPTNSISGLVHNSKYIGYIEDDEGCRSDIENFELPASSLAPIVFDIETNRAGNCYGKTQTDLTFKNVSGGNTNPYEYGVAGKIGSFRSSPNFNDLPSSTFSVFVRQELTPGRYCYSSDTRSRFIIPEYDSLQATITPIAPTCHYSSDGEISVSNLRGGNNLGKYSYFVNDLEYTASTFGSFVSNEKPVITVMDSDSCIFQETVTIPTRDSLLIGITNSTISKCQNPTTGSGRISINVKYNDPSKTYEYSIDGGTTFAASRNFVALTSGKYRVLIKDNDNCFSDTSTVNVGYNIPFYEVPLPSITDALCFGGNTGTVVANPPPISINQYQLNTLASTSGSFTGLAATDDAVFYGFSDPELCESHRLSFDIKEPLPMDLSVFHTEDIICFGDSTGKVEMFAQGGTPNYTFEISDSEGNIHHPESINRIYNDLKGGEYTAVAYDLNRCSVQKNFTIQEYDEVTFTYTLNNQTCYYKNDGTMTLQPSGGTGKGYKYRYNFSDYLTYNKDLVISNIFEKAYTFDFIDSKGCESQPQTIFPNYPLPLYISEIHSGPSCEFFEDGSISIFVNEATSTKNIKYTIDGGKTFHLNSDFKELKTENYVLYAKDDLGCESNQIPLNLLPEVVIDFDYDFSFGKCVDNQGAIVIKDVTGCKNCVFSIDSGRTYSEKSTLTDLKNQSYQILARDRNGCASPIKNLLIDPVFTVDADLEPITCSGANDAQIRLNIEGGVPPYFISWDQGDGKYRNLDFITGLSPGKYSGQVHDYIKCSQEFEVDIKENYQGNVVADFEPDSYVVNRLYPLTSFTNTSIGSTRWYWDFSTSDSRLKNPKNIALPEAIGKQKVMLIAYDDHNCSDTVYKDIDVKNVAASRFAFSPNGDGLNDIFDPTFALEKIDFESCKLLIVDFAGKEIFENSNDCVWDGKLENEIMPPGQYGYFFSANYGIFSHTSSGVFYLIN